jgi:protein TonB
MAMIRRAQPLPPFPPEITVSSMSFTVPVQFSVR